jgi:hypothetical protein
MQQKVQLLSKKVLIADDDPGIEISVGIWRPQSLKRKVSEWWISKPGSLNIRQNGFLELFDQQSLSSIWII